MKFKLKIYWFHNSNLILDEYRMNSLYIYIYKIYTNKCTFLINNITK